MKKVIITIVVVLAALAAIGFVLSKNKKENQAKIDFINEGSEAVPVKVIQVAKAPLKMDFSANGNFVPVQDLKLLSENSGRITSLKVKEGESVKEGQLLATLDDKYLAIDLQTARDSYQKLKTDKTRYESSYQTGGVTKAQLDELDLQLRNASSRLSQAEKRLSDAFVKAPISGVINKRSIEIGSYVSPGTALFEIVDVSSLKLNVSVNEQQVLLLQPGSKVKIKVPAFPDKNFSGTIVFVAAKSDNTLNYPVEIKVDNIEQNKIKAGMYATALFDFEDQRPVISIPRKAFVGSVNSKQVYVLEGTTARLRSVMPGVILGETVEIMEGLSEGETVVVSGQINLVDQTPVEIQKD
jgi:RND family efflux transporter MFP subunit